MMHVDRRVVLGAMAAMLGTPAARAQAGTVRDGAGRVIPRPARVARVFPAGPPAAIMLYTLAPDLLIGWPRANRPDELAFLLPEIGARPEVGRLTGRGNTANLEVVLQARPDLILDVGTISDTYTSLADRVQGQTGIPYGLLDGSLSRIDDAYRSLGQLLGLDAQAAALASHARATLDTVRERVGRVADTARPRVYYARGPQGLETGLEGSINVESIAFLGARNVASAQRGGLATVSLEQVLAWDPEVIVTINRDFFRAVRNDPAWASIAAVRSGRVHLSPRLPFGWVDFPPSVNRLVGLRWLGRALYPDLFPEDLRPLTREFYRIFYHVDISDADVERILAG